MGRKRLFLNALTPAEKQKRHREKIKCDPEKYESVKKAENICVKKRTHSRQIENAGL